MKKKSIIVTALLAAAVLLSVPTFAQIFLQDEELEASLRTRGNGAIMPGVPGTGGEPYDTSGPTNYTPLGSGALILGCLGGAYLLGKRKKEQD